MCNDISELKKKKSTFMVEHNDVWKCVAKLVNVYTD